MIELYKCSFCNTNYNIFETEEDCLKHEKDCFFNPKNKTCNTCKFSGCSGFCNKFKKHIPIVKFMQPIKESFNRSCWETEEYYKN